jgi:hypothetical protein
MHSGIKRIGDTFFRIDVAPAPAKSESAEIAGAGLDWA